MTRQAQDPAPTPVQELHNDGVILVVHKPSGLPTQAPRGGGDNLYDRLRRRYPRLALHHRLDTPASGLVLFTLDPRANAAVAQGFREHLIQRRYWACVVGEPPAEGRWEGEVDGLPALTRFRRLSQGEGLAAVELSLQTGRTHQIRVHAAEAGLPLLGDHRHGGAAGGLWPRLALHAWSLRLDHPKTKAPLTITCPLPEDLVALAARAGSPLAPA